MTPDREEGIRQLREQGGRDFLVKNCRGLAFAAFGSKSQIAAALGVDEHEAGLFQSTARDTLYMLLIEIRTAKARMGVGAR